MITLRSSQPPLDITDLVRGADGRLSKMSVGQLVAGVVVTLIILYREIFGTGASDELLLWYMAIMITGHVVQNIGKPSLGGNIGGSPPQQEK